MAIVKMLRLSLIADYSVRNDLMRDLSKLGCVEVSEPDSFLSSQYPSVLTRNEVECEALRKGLDKIRRAMDITEGFKHTKRALFPKRHSVRETELFNRDFISRAITCADEVIAHERDINFNSSQISAIRESCEVLLPWRELDFPLNPRLPDILSAQFFTCPVSRSLEDIRSAVLSASEIAQIFPASSDKHSHYFLLLCHSDAQGILSDALKEFSPSRVSFGDLSGTAAENLTEMNEKIKSLEKTNSRLREKIGEYCEKIHVFEKCADALDVLLRRETSGKRLLRTKSTVILEGWLPEREEQRVRTLLEGYQCAYHLRPPADNENPPTLTYNLKLFAPYGIITNMYSPPAYRGIDPNPFMAPFFALFFGIMLSDAAYGLLLIVAGAIALSLFKPPEGTRQAILLVVMCGISTFFWGLLFGGFFGDAISAVYTLITDKPLPIDTALWFNPLNDPMKMLILSFALGGVHIFAGMAIEAYMLIRDGRLWDAVFDIGFWWLTLAGAVFFILKMPVVGLGLVLTGAVGLVLTQGRHEKKLIKKFTKGISSLYNITSYLGDILSYSRLLALSLATAVVASVMNTMGVLTGPVGFAFVFIIGHTFNLAINLIGSYVHTARLQYVEFFGKFYIGGGELFRPLNTRTKYVDIIEEEK